MVCIIAESHLLGWKVILKETVVFDLFTKFMMFKNGDVVILAAYLVTMDSTHLVFQTQRVLEGSLSQDG